MNRKQKEKRMEKRLGRNFHRRVWVLIRIMKRDLWLNDEVKKTVDEENYKRMIADQVRVEKDVI